MRKTNEFDLGVELGMLRSLEKPSKKHLARIRAIERRLGRNQAYYLVKVGQACRSVAAKALIPRVEVTANRKAGARVVASYPTTCHLQEYGDGSTSWGFVIEVSACVSAVDLQRAVWRTGIGWCEARKLTQQEIENVVL